MQILKRVVELDLERFRERGYIVTVKNPNDPSSAFSITAPDAESDSASQPSNPKQQTNEKNLLAIPPPLELVFEDVAAQGPSEIKKATETSKPNSVEAALESLRSPDKGDA